MQLPALPGAHTLSMQHRRLKLTACLPPSPKNDTCAPTRLLTPRTYFTSKQLAAAQVTAALTALGRPAPEIDLVWMLVGEKGA